MSVVIPTCRRPDRLESILARLTEQTLPPERWELLIIDDASGPEYAVAYREVVGRSGMALRWISLKTNAGPARARNAGWQAACGDIVAFADDDVSPSPGWLAAALACFEADPALGLLQGATLPPAGTPASLPPWVHTHRIEAMSPYFDGCNLFIRRAALQATGGFDEEIGWWGEDTAAAWAVIDAGWGWAFAPDALVTHPVEQRPWQWWMRNGWLEKNLVVLAARHPGFRAEGFWRPWSFRKRDALFAGAAGSLASALVLPGRWRLVGLAGLVPYLRWAGPDRSDRRSPRAWAELAIVDSARLAGHLAGSLRSRTLVL